MLAHVSLITPTFSSWIRNDFSMWDAQFFDTSWLIFSFCSRFPSAGLSPRWARGRMKSLTDPSAHGNDGVLSCATSWFWNLSTFISKADRLSRSSQSSMSGLLTILLPHVRQNREDSRTHLCAKLMQPCPRLWTRWACSCLWLRTGSTVRQNGLSNAVLPSAILSCTLRK